LTIAERKQLIDIDNIKKTYNKLSRDELIDKFYEVYNRWFPYHKIGENEADNPEPNDPNAKPQRNPLDTLYLGIKNFGINTDDLTMEKIDYGFKAALYEVTSLYLAFATENILMQIVDTSGLNYGGFYNKLYEIIFINIV